MKIAMLVRSYIPAPRPADMIYAPIDLAVALAEGLVERGHTVDYYGPIGTKVKGATVRTCNLRPLVKNQEEFRSLLDDPNKMTHNLLGLWDSKMVNEMFALAALGMYDLLHFHHPEAAMPIAQMFHSVPAVYTLHDPIYDWYKELFELYPAPNQQFISVSDNQRRDAPDLPYVQTIHNGINLKSFPFGGLPEDYLLFVGKIMPDKGVKEAIQVAKQTKRRLLIIGPVAPDNQGYFDHYIKPQLDDKIVYLGFVERQQLWPYYQKAYALLTPVQWEEPFGLTTVEAMACGTPVISLKRGAAQEIIKHGKSGFIVESIGEMIEAVANIDKIDRAFCRDYVKANFSLEKMVDGYEKVFERALRTVPRHFNVAKPKILTSKGTGDYLSKSITSAS